MTPWFTSLPPTPTRKASPAKVRTAYSKTGKAPSRSQSQERRAPAFGGGKSRDGRSAPSRMVLYLRFSRPVVRYTGCWTKVFRISSLYSSPRLIRLTKQTSGQLNRNVKSPPTKIVAVGLPMPEVESSRLCQPHLCILFLFPFAVLAWSKSWVTRNIIFKYINCW